MVRRSKQQSAGRYPSTIDYQPIRMIDCFALLSEPRRPWLDPEALKQKFIALSAELHPDRVHQASEAERVAAQQRYTELNAAYNRLRDPKERLLHLLELELGARPKDIQRIPPDLISLFNELNQACREADALLTEKRTVNSALLKVQMFHRGQQLTDPLAALQRKITHECDALLVEIQRIDSAWDDAANRKAALGRLEEVYRLLSYFNRWTGQLQERIVQLYL
jgi:curved DNA-binding protein CbpA